MDEHICHHGDTLQHRDVVEYHKEASCAANNNFINEPNKTWGSVQTRYFVVLAKYKQTADSMDNNIKNKQ